MLLMNLKFFRLVSMDKVGSGCGSVGRAVASDARGPQFESSHRQNIIHVLTINCIENTKIKEKEAGNGPFKKEWTKSRLPPYFYRNFYLGTLFTFLPMYVSIS